MHGAVFALSVLVYVMPVILVIGGLIALYWVIRRSVAAGIRDARADPTAGED
jgi:hypothetical protein